MNQDEQIETRIGQYTARLRRALGTLQAGEVDDIVLEIQSHIAERLADSADPAAAAVEVLEALGDPEELAAEYQTEALLARGRSSQSPLALMRAAQRWAMEGLFGLTMFLAGILGYSLAAALVLVAVLKPFFPLHIGLWRDPPDLLALGFVSGPPDAQFELLGWWIIPVGLVTGCLLWLGMTRLLG
ncbi:MAG: hypothetical protein GY769_26100, partial [bacterium]|nr:hypothetical protein [bacterium]